MSNLKKVRIYKLAKELKQDVKRIFEELKREGADVSVPSNSVSFELAEKIRNRYFPKREVGSYMKIGIIKKGTTKVITPHPTKLTDTSQKQNMCQYCFKTISYNHSTKRYKQHILNECPEKPVFSHKNVIKYFDLMTEKTNAINKKRFTSIELASYLIDSELISSSNTIYSPFLYFIVEDPIVVVDNGKKKLKVIINSELLDLYYPARIKLKSMQDFIRNDFVKNRTPYFDKMLKWLKTVASFYVKSKKNENFQKVERQAIKDERKLLETESIEWEIFPVGNWFNVEEVSAKLFNHFRSLQSKAKFKDKLFDKSRIDGIIKKLKPLPPATGKKKFEGYIVYSFDWTDKIVLECPLYGNATYVISSGQFSWQEIARNSKLEARTEYSKQVKVINHSETWLERLEQSLKYGL